MRVLMLLGRSAGGIGTHVAELSANLRDRGVEVIVVTHPLTAERFDFGPVRLWWPGSTGWLTAPRDFWRLRRLAVTSDIVHAHGHQASLLATLATKANHMARDLSSGPKLIVSQHNAVLAGSGLERPKRLAQRWVARRADLVAGVSADLVKEALGFGARRAELVEVPAPRVPGLLAQTPADGGTRARIRATLLSSLTPPWLAGPSLAGPWLAGPSLAGPWLAGPRLAGPSLAGPSIAGPSLAGPSLASPSQTRDREDVAVPDTPLVVTISRIATQKNLGVLVEAAARLRSTCIWVVLGDGDPQLLARLERQVRALGAPVRFVGARADVDQWLRAAEVFVLPSLWEGQPLVVREAMAAGTPVVATDVGGLHDMVSGTGLLVIPGDPEAIAAAIDRVLAHPALRDELSTRGREVAKALPNGRETADRWLTWYTETLAMT